MNRTTTGSFELKTKISNIQWRWILPAGTGVAVITYVFTLVMILAYIFLLLILTGTVPDSAQLNSFALTMSAWGMLALDFLLTVPAAAWVVRKVGAEAALHGVLVGLVSAIGIQLIDLPFGPPNFDELTRMLILAVGAGWLGGSLAQTTLSGQKALYRASRTISAARSPQGIVDAIGEHLADPEEISRVVLWQDVSQAEDEASMEIELLTSWTPRAAQALTSGLRLNEAQVPALARLRQQQEQQHSPLSLKVGELPASGRAIWEQHGIRSAILIPLITSSDERVGVLMITSQRTGGFSRGTIRRYLTISAQVALALENFRLVEQARQVGVLRERQRLAHEIHDTLAQGFTSIVMKLEAAEETLPTDPAVTQRHIDQSRRIARESLGEARRLMWALRPESLERSSLPETLARLAERWAEECGAEASTTVTGTPRPLAPEIEVRLLRVGQEALNNCRKHAQARQVVMTLSYMNNFVALDIHDDGVGFDPAKPHSGTSDHSGGFGLNGMRERVEQLGGTLLVESAPGEGTTLVVELPVAADERTGRTTEAVKATPLRGDTI
jgi:signal transduction histidine kinase